MVENIMPAVEAENVEMDVTDILTYELAFHVLPTIAEGEVESVFASIKDIIKKDGGEVFDEESPERFELAYEIEKHMEGKNRKFHSAYFGWVRFKARPENTVSINAEIDHNKSILRHLLVKLTRVEEENPFRFHDAIRDLKQVTTVGESDVVPDFSGVSEEAPAEVKEEGGEVDQEALDKALDEKEV
jgi:ribosomal protein S6